MVADDPGDLAPGDLTLAELGAEGRRDVLAAPLGLQLDVLEPQPLTEDVVVADRNLALVVADAVGVVHLNAGRDMLV